MVPLAWRYLSEVLTATGDALGQSPLFEVAADMAYRFYDVLKTRLATLETSEQVTHIN